MNNPLGAGKPYFISVLITFIRIHSFSFHDEFIIEEVKHAVTMHFLYVF